mmetsp:Transcript_13252/g.34060  ORF Transcript_13252/g.34060 Transcript_13252/m.34060 type:complete len:217 (-) Transcript_13252:188-838(-)
MSPDRKQTTQVHNVPVIARTTGPVPSTSIRSASSDPHRSSPPPSPREVSCHRSSSCPCRISSHSSRTAAASTDSPSSMCPPGKLTWCLCVPTLPERRVYSRLACPSTFSRGTKMAALRCDRRSNSTSNAASSTPFARAASAASRFDSSSSLSNAAGSAWICCWARVARIASRSCLPSRGTLVAAGDEESAMLPSLPAHASAGRLELGGTDAEGEGE